MKLAKIALLGAGLLCFGCANTGTPTPSASVPMSSSGRQPQQPVATQDSQDKQFLQLMRKHDRIGIELAESARQQQEARSIQQLADNVVQQNTSQLEELERLEQKLLIHATKDKPEARTDTASSVASDRQDAEMSGNAFRNDSVRNAQSTDEEHTNGTLADSGTALTAGTDLGPTSVVSGGADYSQRWLNTMVQHQQAMLNLTQQMLPNLQNPEVKQFAERVVEQKQQLVAELQQQNGSVGQEPE